MERHKTSYPISQIESDKVRTTDPWLGLLQIPKQKFELSDDFLYEKYHSMSTRHVLQSRLFFVQLWAASLTEAPQQRLDHSVSSKICHCKRSNTQYCEGTFVTCKSMSVNWTIASHKPELTLVSGRYRGEGVIFPFWARLLRKLLWMMMVRILYFLFIREFLRILKSQLQQLVYYY